MPLAYTCHGNPGGWPVFYCHGTPGSSCEVLLPTRLADQVYLIAVDRPGYGKSPFIDSYPVSQFASDLEQLADHLKINAFSALGFSGGGFFALTAAALLPERLKSLGLLSTPAPHEMQSPLDGTGPMNGPIWATAKDQPEKLIEQLQTLLKDAPAIYQVMTGSLCENDQKLFTQKQVADTYLKAMSDALAQGSLTLATRITQELQQLLQPWPFELRNIQQPVFIYQGTTDQLIRPVHAEALSRALPRAELTIDPAGGHYQGIGNPSRFAELLLKLVSASQASGQ
ncbi:Pimeloyl-ACP methyl ester carboxylesterase [Marinospirillum celere]|uniref:Pimeloyl-ACP methyl ester carboxylesterase n=1 Tax=Marinospirillum celere TaxID=1122252 RepID=A0A1I1J4N4_9GAMM|nr:alpha/beta hydrolase [Marinospirillum celere]SFC40903.1 Pimeloyl-ACP methyl ester carboxylesterase [Marinospirillum celere]